jgi:hypothetical protein
MNHRIGFEHLLGLAAGRTPGGKNCVDFAMAETMRPLLKPKDAAKFHQ